MFLISASGQVFLEELPFFVSLMHQSGTVTRRSREDPLVGPSLAAHSCRGQEFRWQPPVLPKEPLPLQEGQAWRPSVVETANPHRSRMAAFQYKLKEDCGTSLRKPRGLRVKPTPSTETDLKLNC